MKLNSVQDYPQTADVYAVVGIDPNTEQNFFRFLKKIKVKVVVNDRRTILLTQEDIPLGWIVQNITDPSGTEVDDVNAWRVTNINPVTNVFGYVEGKSYLMGNFNRQS